jgi:hypothetical protein
MVSIEPSYGWSHAFVSEHGQLQVVVRYSYPELDDELRGTFARRNEEIIPEPWGRMEYLSDNRVIVDDVESDAVDQLHDALEAILKIAHEDATPLRRRREASEAEEAEERNAQAQDADDMTTRFRQFGDDAA